MNTKVVTIKEDHIDEEAIQEAGQILKNGGLVAFPTETVYGARTESGLEGLL